MSEENKKESNIFDLASKKSKKEEPKKAQPEPLPTPPPKIESKEALDEMYLRCKRQSEEIQSKIEGFFDKTRLTPKDLREFIKSPKFDNAYMHEEFDKNKKKFEKRLESLKQKKVESDGKEEKKEKEKLPKDKKKGVVKKGWIPMR